MRYRIENNRLALEVESRGAEMKSLIKKETGQELLWSGDPEYWSGVSPLLFPFIGALRDGKYRYRGKEYSIGRHGFAQEMEFEAVQQGRDRLVLAVEDTAQTRGAYPFAFRLEVEYIVDGSEVRENWRVYNRGKDTLYFSIGGHPAFACPPGIQKPVQSEPEGSGPSAESGAAGTWVEQGGNGPSAESGAAGTWVEQGGNGPSAESGAAGTWAEQGGNGPSAESGAAAAAVHGCGDRTSCSIRLFGVGDRDHVDSLCVVPGGLLNGKTVPVEVREGRIAITGELFSIDTILLRDQITGAALCDGSGREYLQVESDAPVWGIWSKEDSRASYICLEPWFGLCDYQDCTAELSDRPFTNSAEPGEMWEQGYLVRIL